MERFAFNLKTLLLAAGMSLVAISCGSDEDDPEIVPDPMDTAAYYIAGAVNDYESASAIPGVTVTAGDASAVTDTNGLYELTVTGRQKYTVSFSKTGYLPVNGTAEVAATADNHSTVFLSAMMSVKGVEATIDSKGATVGNKASLDESAVEMIIPAGAIPAGSNAVLSVTPYMEPAVASTTVQTGQVNSSLSLGEMHIESSLSTFAAPISLVWQHVATPSIGFSEADVWSSGVLTKAPSDWKKEGVATLSGDNYVFGTQTLNTGYSLETTVNIATSAVGKEANLVNGQAEVTVDNSEKTTAITDYPLTTASKAGWEYTTTPTQALSGIGITGNDLTTMAAVLTRAVENEEGGVPTIFTVETTTHASISGGYIMHYKNEATYCSRTYTFACVAGGQNKAVVVGVKRYLGSVASYSNQPATQHSGGKF